MADSKGKPEISVEALLKLKRLERPDDRFWDTFERDFERRRLQALTTPPSWRDRLWIPSVRLLAISVPALVLMGLFVLQQGSYQDSHVHSNLGSNDVDPRPPALALDTVPAPGPESIPEMRTSLASSQFVLDAILPTDAVSGQFRKVLYSPAIRVSAPDGSVYVKDSFSPTGIQVTTADLKLGRNF